MRNALTIDSLFAERFLPQDIVLYDLIELCLFVPWRHEIILIVWQLLVLVSEMPLDRQIVERLVAEAALSISPTIFLAGSAVSINVS